MDIICKEKYNVIFWRNSPSEEWQCEDLDVVIDAYQDEPYTELELWKVVYKEGTEEPLYYVYECKKCDELILTVDADHGYKFCPHCGRAIWSE